MRHLRGGGLQRNIQRALLFLERRLQTPVGASPGAAHRSEQKLLKSVFRPATVFAGLKLNPTATKSIPLLCSTLPKRPSLDASIAEAHPSPPTGEKFCACGRPALQETETRFSYTPAEGDVEGSPCFLRGVATPQIRNQKVRKPTPGNELPSIPRNSGFCRNCSVNLKS